METSAFTVGGWTVQLLSAMVAVAINAFTFLTSALFLMSIRAPEVAAPSLAQRPDALGEVWHGLKFVMGNPVLRAITVSRLAEQLQFGIVGAVILVFGVRELGFGTGVLATIFALGGVSALVGASVAPRITRRLGVGPSMTLGFLLFGLSILLIPLARGPLVIAGLLLAAAQLFDAAYTVYNINEVSLRQSVTPDRLLGRVIATVGIVGIGALLVGSLLGGILAESIGLRWTLVVGAGSGTLGAIWLFLSPIRRIKEAPVPA